MLSTLHVQAHNRFVAIITTSTSIAHTHIPRTYQGMYGTWLAPGYGTRIVAGVHHGISISYVEGRFRRVYTPGVPKHRTGNDRTILVYPVLYQVPVTSAKTPYSYILPYSHAPLFHLTCNTEYLVQNITIHRSSMPLAKPRWLTINIKMAG